jgi:hypothetical protein
MSAKNTVYKTKSTSWRKIMDRIVKITWLIIAGVILVACNPTPEDKQPPTTDPAKSDVSSNIPEESTPEDPSISYENSPTSEPAQDRALRPTVTVRFEKVKPVDLPNEPPSLGEVPEEILEKIIADLVQRTNADEKNIKVIRSQAVTWRDGSLGCPKPGVFYTQALVDGYWVILQIEGTDYDYRVSNSGYFTLCEGRGGIPISPPFEITPEK